MHSAHASYTRPSLAKQIVGLAGWLLLTFAAAAVGALATAQARDFYHQLLRPEWAPPGWLFGPVWSVLYLLMGIAAWLVWRERGQRGVRVALGFYTMQLIANTLWSWLFFTWHRGTWASGEIVLLWVAILCTLVLFWRVRRIAGILLLPYLAWVSFATALCFKICSLNPGAL